MKNTLRFIAAAIFVLAIAACDKDKKPELTDFSGCEPVDLGLSVKWAPFNIGAISEYSVGAFFAWGETKEKGKYGWSTSTDYLWGIYDSDMAPLYGMTKYTAGAEGGDGLINLQPCDDPATVLWGTKWRTPTLEEIKELLNCQWGEWDEERAGRTVKGPNGNTIFFPAAGSRINDRHDDEGKMGLYWSSTVDEDRVANACLYRFDRGLQSWTSDYRSNGLCIRAVTD